MTYSELKEQEMIDRDHSRRFYIGIGMLIVVILGFEVATVFGYL